MIYFLQTHLSERARKPRKIFNLTVQLSVRVTTGNVKAFEERTNKVIVIVERNVSTSPLNRIPGYLQPFEFQLKNLKKFNSFESNITTPNNLYNANIVHYGFVCTNPAKSKLKPQPDVSVKVSNTGSRDPNPVDLAGNVFVPECNKFKDATVRRKYSDAPVFASG